MMFLGRALAVSRPTGLRNVAQLSSRARVPGSFSVFQQQFSANDNKGRSYSWLFQDAKETTTTATIRLKENERGETVFEGSRLSPHQHNNNEFAAQTQVNKQASYDFLFAEPKSPFGAESAIGDMNRTKSSEYLFENTPKEQANLLKVFHSLVQEGLAKHKEQGGDEAALQETANQVERAIRMMNRNARAPKKANRGRRPCSHVARRSKRMKRHKGW